MASRTRNLIIIGAASVALAAAGVLPAAALAHGRGPLRPRDAHFGTVASVSGTTLTLSARNGTTYAVDASSAKVVKEGAAITLSSVSVGDPVAVIGPVTGTDIAARTIIDGPQKRFAPRGSIVGGTIASLTAGSFTVTPKTRPGTSARPAVTVDTDAETVVSKRGQKVSLDALVPGAHVVVSGTRESTGALLASKVLIRGR